MHLAYWNQEKVWALLICSSHHKTLIINPEPLNAASISHTAWQGPEQLPVKIRHHALTRGTDGEVRSPWSSCSSQPKMSFASIRSHTSNRDSVGFPQRRLVVGQAWMHISPSETRIISLSPPEVSNAIDHPGWLEGAEMVGVLWLL